MIQKSTVRRLGTTAGQNIATGAIQRLEQSLANFEQRNDVEPGDHDLFAEEVKTAFLTVVLRTYTALTFDKLVLKDPAI